MREREREKWVREREREREKGVRERGEKEERGGGGEKGEE